MKQGPFLPQGATSQAFPLSHPSMFTRTHSSREWKYFATNEWIEYNGKKYRGLALPPPMLRKLYHDNAVCWVPGILGKP